MAACPYDVRYVNPLKKNVQKCDFCVHRIDAGLAPACVEACPVGAMLFGDMHDPASEIARLVATHPIQVVKPEMATKPHVFYINADLEVMDAKGGAPWKSQE
jgi:tetrathionate reductase subunit B